MEKIFTYLLIFGAIILGYFIIVIVNYLFAKRLPKDTVIALTGGLGQGKSLIGVTLAIKKLRRFRLLWVLGYLNQEEIPQLYSNIPIRFRNNRLIRALDNKKWLTLIVLFVMIINFVFIGIITLKATDDMLVNVLTMVLMILIVSIFYIFVIVLLSRKSIIEKEEMSIILKYEHITYIERQNEYNVTFLDEIGQTASQWDYDNPFVMIYIQEYIRYYRHVYDGCLIYTDQSSENVAKPIRVRTNKIYNLIDFHRSWLYFYKVTVIEMLVGEDVDTIYSNQMDNPPYYFGHLPFKWFKFLDLSRLSPFVYKKYESRVHKPLYDHVEHAVKNEWPDNTLFNELKYIIEVPQNQSLKKRYLSEGYITMEYMLKFIEDQKNIRKRINIETADDFVEIDYYEIDKLKKKAKQIYDSISYLEKLGKETHKMEISRLRMDVIKVNQQIINLIQNDIQN